MSAVISPCANYRYLLTRKTNSKSDRVAVFVMLNPSTADAAVDDPTVRRCIAFAERENCGELRVVNLFAYRSTNPRALINLKSVIDVCGPENREYVMGEILQEDVLVIAAWGAHPAADCDIANEIRGIFDVKCLGLTKFGHPKHPLYVRADSPLMALA